MKVMPRESLLVLGLATAFFLLLGVVFGVFVGSCTRPTATPVPTATLPFALLATPVTPAPGQQVSILLLGVDSLAAPRPQLEAVWVVTFQYGQPQYFLVGFSPATHINIQSTAGAHSLRQVFDVETSLKLERGHPFIRDALASIAPSLAASGYEVVYDRAMLAWTISNLNGVHVRGEWLTGESLLARHDAIPPENDADRLAFQGEALLALLESARYLSWSPDILRTYFNLGQKWQPDAETLFLMAEAALETLPEAEFYIQYAPLRLEPAATP
jgi:hypothetical protein